jgi:serine/threonine protein kinase/WD40 repeat protein
LEEIMPSSSADRNPVERLAEEFAERFRNGERPSLTEYTERYPDLADDIRELFPALVVMERLKPAPADATSPPGPTAPGGAPLRSLGDYRILRKIGWGGMGVVYEAEQESLGRHVALKVLPAQAVVNPTYLERFCREARAAARLHHTNIVPVFGVGEVDGVHYYAMQYIAGEALDRVLRDLRRLRRHDAGDTTEARPSTGSACAGLAASLASGRFAAPPAAAAPPDLTSDGPSGSARAEGSSGALSAEPSGGYYRSVARVGVQVADALAYAHRQGVLHRDVKPSNLLLEAQGTVWVADFGLAKADGSDDLTHTGDVVGTVRYMAPERFDGHSLPQSDVYSLGLTLYELLVLRPAFDDSNRARLIERVLHELPPRPRKLDPRVPRDLETVVLKCLAKDPAERYATAEALAEDLRRFLAYRPIRARRTPWYEHGWRWARRNPAVATLLLAVLGLLAAVAGVSTVAAVQVQAQKDQLDQAYRALEGSREEEKGAKEDALVKLREARLAQAQAGRRSDQAGRRFNSLAALREAARLGPGLELRNEAAACLALVDLRPAPGRLASLPLTTRLMLEPRFERYARVDDQGNVVVRSVADDRELLHLHCPRKFVWPGDWSPDGRYLAVAYAKGGEGEFLVCDLSRGEACRHLRAQTGPGRFAFSPDGRQAAVSLGDGAVRVLEVASGKELRCWDVRARPSDVAFHPGGRLLAVSSADDPDVIVYDLSTGQQAQRLHHAGGVYRLAWSPGGRQLATCCRAAGFAVYLWDVARNQARLLQGHQAEPTHVAFNHRGDLLASAGWDGPLRLWDPASGRALLALPTGGWGLQFSPDDRLLVGGAFGDGHLAVYEVAAGREYRSLVGHEGGKGPWGVDVSPDGRLIASAGADGVRLWDAVLGREVARLPCGEMDSVLIHPAGDSLIASGPGGVFRWMMAAVADTKAEKRLRIGRCELLGLPAIPDAQQRRRACLSTDGQVLAVADRAAGRLFQYGLTTRSWKVFAPGQPNVSYVAISQDGRWIATGPWWPGPVTVWDARTGNPVRTLLHSYDVGVLAFSPDGKWLVGGTAEKYLFWEVGSWQLRRERPRMGNCPVLAFSPDGRVLATVPAHGLIRLTEPETGRELVTLEPPDPGIITWLRFSPDGTRLVASTENHAVQVWDLRRLRQGLADIGLDWDPPPYAPAADDSANPAPLVVEVDASAAPPTKGLVRPSR